MKRTMFAAVLMLLLGSAAHAAGLGYDPEADPFDQYREAVATASAQHKLVLVIAGGDWCHWCHVLSRFVDANADIETSLNETFVVIKVYVGPDNYNELFFSQLPQAYGAPHFWIISPEREVLASQSTAKLEQGKRYDKASFLAFIEQWRQTSRGLHRQAANAPDRSPSAAMGRSPSAAGAGANERPIAGAKERPPAPQLNF